MEATDDYVKTAKQNFRRALLLAIGVVVLVFGAFNAGIYIERYDQRRAMVAFGEGTYVGTAKVEIPADVAAKLPPGSRFVLLSPR